MFVLGAVLISAWILLSWYITTLRFDTQIEEVIEHEQNDAKEISENMTESVRHNLHFIAGIPDSLQQSTRLNKAINQFGVKPLLQGLSRQDATKHWRANAGLEELNNELNSIQHALGVDMIFLVNATGDCIASSNLDNSSTPIGSNFSDRDYFIDGIKGMGSMQYAVGRTTHKAGIYFSSPVWRGGHFNGIVVAKVDVSSLSFLTRKADVYVVDNNGVIIMAHNEDMLFHSIHGAAVNTMSDEKRLKLYAQINFPELKISPWRSSTLLKKIRDENFPRVLASTELAEYGMTVYAENDLPSLHGLEHEKLANFRLMSLIGTSLLIIGGGLIFHIQNKRLQKQAELEQRAFYEHLIETLGEGLYVQDQNGNCTHMNSEAEKLLGWRRDELIGKSMHDITHKHSPDGDPSATADCKIMMRVNENGSCYCDDQMFVSKEGRIFPVELWSRSIVRNGVNQGTVVAFRDMSERRQAELAIIQAKEEAERANRVKGDFLANMSHEIRTPMNGVIGMTELALDTDLNPEQREYLGMVKSSANALLAIINDILDFSKIEAGKMNLENIDFNFEDMLSDTAQAVAPRAHQKGLELLLDIAPTVPDIVQGDPGRLRQIILNLLGNAIKFTDQGEIKVRVDGEVQVDDPKSIAMHIGVSDSGIGIPADKLQTIFESFSQADTTTTRKYGGMGLGLAITSQLVGLMHGRIWVESDIGKGSIFHIEVPLGRGAVAANPKYEAVKLADMHVLVVDDNVTNREIAVELLKRWKMRPIAVTGGQAALAELERARCEDDGYQLMLLDMSMPDFDGFAVAEYLHAHPDLSAARIMLLTSSGQRGDATRCRELGIAAYLHKPYTQRVLFEAIMDTIGLSKIDKAPLVTRHTIMQNKRSLKILLAEDNSVNQLLATRLLEKLGHNVEVAGNGLIAVNKWKNAQYDLILMDIDMPEMNGIDATTLIRTEEQRTGKHISIIGLTAHAMQGSREKFLAAGMDGYLSKPIDTEALWNELESIKSSHSNPASRQINAAVQLENSSLSFDLKRALPMMDNDMELFNEMVGIFLGDYPIQMEALRKAIDTGDIDTIRHKAHSIKGMVSVFATPEIAAIAQRIEMQPDNDHARDFAELAKALSWLAATLTKSLKSDHLNINE